jgi:hypothetical protein
MNIVKSSLTENVRFIPRIDKSLAAPSANFGTHLQPFSFFCAHFDQDMIMRIPQPFRSASVTSKTWRPKNTFTKQRNLWANHGHWLTRRILFALASKVLSISSPQSTIYPAS